MYSAAQALGQVVRDSGRRRPCRRRFGHHADDLSGRQVPSVARTASTLLHGDFWAGNIVCDDTGDMVVLDGRPPLAPAFSTWW
jgi:fructosamine-3-kinase